MLTMRRCPHNGLERISSSSARLNFGIYIEVFIPPPLSPSRLASREVQYGRTKFSIMIVLLAADLQCTAKGNPKRMLECGHIHTLGEETFHLCQHRFYPNRAKHGRHFCTRPRWNARASPSNNNCSSHQLLIVQLALRHLTFSSWTVQH
jgi:hypothetical protein